MKDRHLPQKPYPGLRPFQRDEWSIFFGREAMIDAVLDRLGEQQLVVVHGSSGCGKSSLIKAGVLPRLEQEHDLHEIGWQTAEMRPGSSPLWNLAETIGRLIENLKPDEVPSTRLTRSISRRLNLGEAALARIQEDFGLGKDGNVCLLLDQFEELFRYSREIGLDEASTLVDVLRAYPDNPPPGINIIVTMRSDHLGDCAQFPGFADLVNQTQYLLPRMDKTALMRSIREPARLFGGEVDIDLAMRLIDESQNEVDALPLVQHCLMRQWHRRSSEPADASTSADKSAPFPVLTVAGYEGLQRLLSDHADEVLAQLIGQYADSDGDVEAVTEIVFRAITEIDGEGRGIRRPIRKSELESLVGDRHEVLDTVIRYFSDEDCGFLVCSRDDDPVVDISHEALIRCWSRFNDKEFDQRAKNYKGWLYREQEDARLWNAMLVQAENGVNIPDSQLRDRERWFNSLAGSAWAERYDGGWDQVKTLVKNSRKAVRRRLMMYGSVALLIVGMTAVFALLQRGSAERAQAAAEQALARQLAAESQQLPDNSGTAVTATALLAIESIRRAQTVSGYSALRSATRRLPDNVQFQHDAEVHKVVLSADAKLLATASADNNARLWNVESGELIAKMPHEDDVIEVVFSADSSRLATASDDKTARVWSTDDGAQLQVFEHEDGVTAVAFSGGGRFLTSVGKDNSIVIWEIDKALKLHKMQHDGAVTDIVFNPDDRRFATASHDNSARIWDAGRGVELARFDHDDDVSAIAFSADGEFLITGSWDKTARIWDVASRRRLQEFTHDGVLTAVAFSTDGRLAGTAAKDNTARVYDVVVGEELQRLTHDDDVNAIAFNARGDRLISASSDNTARIWNVADGKELHRVAHDGGVNDVVRSVDGNTIATASSDYTARFWEIHSKGREIQRLSHDDDISTVAFNGGLNRVAMAAGNNTVRLWNEEQNSVVDLVHEDWVSDVALTDDGSRVATASWDDTARIWDSKSGEEQLTFTHDDDVYDVEFSSDEKLVATSSWDNSARLWDADTGELIHSLQHPDDVAHIVFSSDGGTLASVGVDKNVRIWDVDGGHQLQLLEHDVDIVHIVFSADGEQLATIGADNAARLWSTKDGELEHQIERVGKINDLSYSVDGEYIAIASADNTARILSADDTEVLHSLVHDDDVFHVEFSRDGGRVATASRDRTVRVWDVDSGKELQRLGHAERVSKVTFSNDGERIASSSEDNSAHVWLINGDKLVDALCQRLTRNMSCKEWSRFLGNAPYRSTCDGLPGPEICP